MRTLADIAALLESAADLVGILRTVSALGIDDCWIAAGFVRNAVWDHLHDRPVGLVAGADVDVIYCDHARATLEHDLAIEARLAASQSSVPWSVHNQARMYQRNGDEPYRDCAHAISFYPETATAIAARWRGAKVELIAPLGVDDLLALMVRPTPAFRHKMHIYEARIATKNWAQRWPRLRFVSA